MCVGQGGGGVSHQVSQALAAAGMLDAAADQGTCFVVLHSVMLVGECLTHTVA